MATGYCVEHIGSSTRTRDGTLCLTDAGHEFLHQESGDTEAFLDEREGLAKLLAMVADTGPTRAGGLLAQWSEYLTR